MTQKRHRVAVTEVNDIDVDLTGVSHAGQVQDRVDDRLSGMTGIVRVRLGGEVGTDVDVRPDDLMRPQHIEAWLVAAKDVRYGYDLDELADEPTVRGQFVRDVQAAADLTDEDRRRVLMTGLRAFDRRDDLEVR